MYLAIHSILDQGDRNAVELLKKDEEGQGRHITVPQLHMLLTSVPVPLSMRETGMCHTPYTIPYTPCIIHQTPYNIHYTPYTRAIGPGLCE
ncbi:hypothetical protein EON63_19205 [archaeon]|nr:MAG: hypothetical protein EON63_19205 [archaeon]